MSIRLIVLNGASSSGKSGLARCLQAVLPQPWLTCGVDTFIQMMPAAMQASESGIEVAADGTVSVGAEFRELEAAWRIGVGAMARAGARIIVDDVFLGGAASQQRWLDALGDLPALWVAVRCDQDVAAGREIARGDRVPGMAASQAKVVHEGVRYDVEVDTTRTEAIDCARIVAAALS
jgi:chloramphenicol 3-O phosphotransferase